MPQFQLLSRPRPRAAPAAFGHALTRQPFPPNAWNRCEQWRGCSPPRPGPGGGPAGGAGGRPGAPPPPPAIPPGRLRPLHAAFPLDPVSSAPGSAQDLTWTAILPKDGTVPVSAVGPTFWWGGTVTRPEPALAVRPGFPGAAVLPGRHREHLLVRWRLQRDLRSRQVLGVLTGLAGHHHERQGKRGLQRRALQRGEQ